MYRFLAVTAAATFLVSPAQAQPLGKPGLWEATASNPELDQARTRMAQQMANMPPAQRAQVQAMMNNMGVGITPAGATRVCVSPEMAKNPVAAAMPEGCEGKSRASGRRVSFEYACADGSKGRGEFDYPDDLSYSGWTEGTAKGRMMRIEHAGRWLSADCGDLKPMKRPGR